MAPKNQAAWIVEKKSSLLKVSGAPYSSPGPGQVTTKNGAVAINPFDWVLQYQSGMLAGHLKYPMVLGTDVAGTVVEVGPGVTRFKVGDRIAGNAVSAAKESNDPAEGAFQLYSVMRENMITKVPEHFSHEQAASLGLGVVTATYGLFHKDYLGLDMPQHGQKYPRAVIVTGGASSVGASAVQLAVSAGYKVFSTSSPKNFAMVKRLGAAEVFDYNSSTLVSDLEHALKGYKFCGAYSIGANADAVCVSVIRERLAKSPELPTKKFVALAGGKPMAADAIKGAFGLYRMMGNMTGMMSKNAITKFFTGVQVKFIMMTDLIQADSCVSNIYLEFLGPALANGQFVPAPEPKVVGHGLEKINEALEINQKGVSANKVVVSLP
ncbi:chaperonin 10-like protein [Penicillium malachiteum]|uniref:chaperonin 10-like protein n=1 Tax=Penicillium malachiteum TaxID=1324776 RepID=UPI0025483A01|nr:chaperonin 10-like protein [Penicillium malachiteum]KAJ5715232.1 chaperonin 10-like protein [Penicillium malachiteum]